MAQTGTIEDMVVLAKNRYPNADDQAKYIQIGIDLIKRDHSDEVKNISFPHSGLDFQVTGFADAGGVYFWYNIYRGTQKIASKLERMKNDTVTVLFSSNSEFDRPLTPMFIN